MPEVIRPYDGSEFYELELLGMRRRLPLINVSEDTWIAYFDSLGDREFIVHCARILAERVRDCDVLMTSETKGIPLVHEIAGILGHSYYLVCRKEVKDFMKDPVVTEYKPITSQKTLKLSLDGRLAVRVRGKTVGIVDDIVSTKETIDALERIARQAGATRIKKAAILVEGFTHDDVEYLGVLPIFKRV